MDAATIDKRIAALLAGDDLLQTRLAEVEAKFDAWLTAMSAGQNLLREAVRCLRKAPGSAVTEPLSAESPTATPESQSLGVVPGVVDDERLLETLDPDTANAIRVKRRLCGDKRSVRELLEEVQAARAGKPPPRKRWWRRGDE